MADGSAAGVSPDPHGPCRHQEDSDHNPLWVVRVPFAFVYLDDILVASRNEAEHKQHLREVLIKLRDNGMAINASKCVMGQSSVKYLGQEISAEGVRPLPSKLQSIIDEVHHQG